jgi:hypothetical protein
MSVEKNELENGSSFGQVSEKIEESNESYVFFVDSFSMSFSITHKIHVWYIY